MPNYRLAARRAAERHGVDPDVFERQIEAESNFSPTAGSSAGARGIAQFMPATARSFGVNLNDGRVSDDLDGAARMMRKALKDNGGDYKKALSVYNSGRPDGYLHFAETRAYVQKILSGQTPRPLVDPVVKVRTTATTAPPAASVDTVEARAGLLKQYLATRGQPGSLLGLAGGLNALDSAAAAPSPMVPVVSRPGAVPRPAGSGTGVFKTTGPNPKRLKPVLVSFARSVAAEFGEPLTGSDGTGHSRLTVNGNVSQHTTGNATDIPATGKRLIRMGQAALIAAGMPREQARQQTGGLYNVNGHQIIFNTHEGGDHTDHLHISAR